MKRESLSLGRIRWSDRRFSFSSDIDPSPLADSIRRTGLLNPPRLLRENGRLIVISGRRRLQALRSLGERSTEGDVYRSGNLAPFKAWQMNFEENITVRDLDAAESCRVVGQLAGLGLGLDEIAGDYLPLLALPPREKTCRTCLAAATLGETFLALLATGTITLTTAAFLIDLDGKARLSASRHLTRARLTVSQQREWVRLAGDIARRDGIEIPSLLAAAARRARKDSAFGGDILQYLRERRYPEFTKRKKAYGALLRSIALPPHVKVETHPFFERSELKVSFAVRDAASLDRTVELLGRIHRESAFGDLLPGRPLKKR